MTGSVHKERNRNAMTLTGKISIYHGNQLSSLSVGELELSINEKVRVVTDISSVQDRQKNIKPASDSNSESNSDSDRVERIVGSTTGARS